MKVVLETLEGTWTEAPVTGWRCSPREAEGPWRGGGGAGACLIACRPHSLLVSSQRGDVRTGDSCSFCNIPLQGPRTAYGSRLCLGDTLERPVSNALRRAESRAGPAGSGGAGASAPLEAPAPWGPSPASSWDLCFPLRKQPRPLTGVDEKLCPDFRSVL